MADATADFFDDLSKRGQEPLLGKMRATVRFDIADGDRTDRWLLSVHDGSLAVTRGDGDADCVITADKADFDLVATGRRNPMAAALRGDHDDGRQPPPPHPCPAPVPGAGGHAGVDRPALDRQAEELSDGRNPRPDPRREHVRRERRAGRHRGLQDRSDGPVLVRHALPVDVGPDDQRPAAQRPLDRRPPVLRGPLLPRPGDRHRLHRPEAVGDPPARSGPRLPRGADDPQPQRRAVGPHDPDRGRDRLRRPVRGQGRAPEAGHLRHPRRRPVARPRLPARDVPARDHDLGHGAGGRRRARPDVHGQGRAARHLDDRPRRRDVAGRPRPPRHRDEVRPGEPQGQARHGARASRTGSPTRRTSSATGSRSRRPTGGASSTSPRSASRR